MHPIKKLKQIIRRIINRINLLLKYSKYSGGGIVLTFDDAYIEEWYSIRELLKKYNARVTFFLSFMNLQNSEQISKLKQLKMDGHEMACHGLMHLDAKDYVENNSIDKYLQKEIIPAINIMKSNGFQPVSFSYPYGSHTELINEALLNYFSIIRTSSANNAIYYNSWQHIIGGIGIDTSYNNQQKIQRALKNAKSKNEIIVLYGHKTTNEPGDYHTSFDQLESILKLASDNELPFYRMCDLR